MPEAADELGRKDEDKVGKVLEAMGCTEASDRTGWMMKRLGKPTKEACT